MTYTPKHTMKIGCFIRFHRDSSKVKVIKLIVSFCIFTTVTQIFQYLSLPRLFPSVFFQVHSIQAFTDLQLQLLFFLFFFSFFLVRGLLCERL